ncbi:MAG: hypothetical protein QE277_05885 [Flectobacillus sp.]|nr:hypothetical protein [Flectobacillus sp.]
MKSLLFTQAMKQYMVSVSQYFEQKTVFGKSLLKASVLFLFFTLTAIYQGSYAQCVNTPKLSSNGATLGASGTSGLCLLCSVSGTANLLDADLTDFATISIPVGVGGSGYVSVKMGQTYPAGTRAGFVADVNGGIAGLFNGISLVPYLNGVAGTPISSGSLFNILGLGGGTNISAVFCQPFDEVRISAGSLAGVLASYKIYYAYVATGCAFPVQCGTASTLPEICANGIDDDGDGLVDSEDLDCASPCKCGDNLNCGGTNTYTTQTAAFAAYDDTTPEPSFDLRSYNLTHSLSHSYPICIDYTTGPNETRIGIRNLVTFTQTCTGFARTYKVTPKSDCDAPLTSLGLNFTGGTRNFDYYDVQPNTTYRLCATVTTSPCSNIVSGEAEAEYLNSTWYVYNSSPDPGSFAFNCGAALTTGTFIANGTSGQTGTITVPITGATAGPVTLTVSGNGFSGSFTTNLTLGQLTVTFPITFDGSGTGGTPSLTVSSSQGTGTCTKAVVVAGAPVAGTVNCSKTEIYEAPVVGTPSQLDLIVTLNVVAGGTFSPVSVSGSGISLANGVSSVTTSAIGIQKIHIPIKYDGSALGTLNFTIGTAGSCTADMTKPSSVVSKNVYLLDGCTAIIPGTLTK